jgi:SAM-dependent methyltransferase
VIGIDVASGIRDNPYLDGAVLYDGISLPIETDTFDVCVARWVIEHIAAPQSVLNEIARVMRPGGRFVFITMNAWFYAGVLARIVPNRLHGPIVKWATGRESRDTFPTYYRANTRRRLRRLLHEAGFKEEMLRVELGDPAYLQFSRLTYALGVLFHKVVNKVPRLEDLGQAVIGSFVKQ